VKLSTKGRYGVTAMYDLALHYGTGYVPLKSIAERQNLSETYLEQIIAPLRKAGLVRSSRGSQGGYALAREPQVVTVGDIIRVLEGPIAPVDCVIGENGAEFCGKTEVCITRDIWLKLKHSIEGVLDSITLADLCTTDSLEKVQEG
jgi:Rrf2 family transcriptional regulator, cysteine metabolism repressor